MIELPEALTLATQITEAFGGKKIVQAIVNRSPHRFAFFEGDPASYPKRLIGRTVSGSASYGGYVLMLLDGLNLSFNDGINARYLRPGSASPDKHQLYLTFDDGSGLVCTVSMYGFIGLAEEGKMENEYFETARLKPSPLSAEFDMAYFRSLLSNTKLHLSVKAFLATEQRIPGVGNGVLQDILFRAGLHPKTKVALLNEAELETMYHSVKSTLRMMADGGGRDTEKDLYGHPGAYQGILSRNTLSKPCTGCGGVLTREAYLGGNIYYCTTCQPLKAGKPA